MVIDDDVTPEIRYRGFLTQYDPTQRYGHYERHFFAEFDSFYRPGRYRLRLSDGKISAPFSIGSDLYARLIPLMLRYFDVQAAASTTAQRSDCHGDDGISAAGHAMATASPPPAVGMMRATI